MGTKAIQAAKAMQATGLHKCEEFDIKEDFYALILN